MAISMTNTLLGIIQKTCTRHSYPIHHSKQCSHYSQHQHQLHTKQRRVRSSVKQEVSNLLSHEKSWIQTANRKWCSKITPRIAVHQQKVRAKDVVGLTIVRKNQYILDESLLNEYIFPLQRDKISTQSTRNTTSACCAMLRRLIGICWLVGTFICDVS